MNIILNLFDEKYVIGLFTKEILPKYPEFKKIESVKIKGHKEMIWEKTYHVVVEFRTVFLAHDGKKKTLPIFCSAHSEEPRENVYVALDFLWKRGFGRGCLTIPHPLFYSKYFRAVFYRGAPGNDLYHYIGKSDFENIEAVIVKAALWFSKLHSINTVGAENFNKENSRIRTVFPGVEHIFFRIKEDFPEYFDIYEKFYKLAIEKEEKFLNSAPKHWLIHGDAHPENIIRMDKKKIAVIDFTDICLADFARDLGSFCQQVEYMCDRKIADKSYAQKAKNIFLENYLKDRKIEMDDSLQKRMDIYYYWTAMRTSTFFLIKSGNEPERARNLIRKVKEAISDGLFDF
ncbi:MAG: aminoglycoside phosphotransferase family protein [bacterium]